MNLDEIERLLILFKKMLNEHPEICPHDYTQVQDNYNTKLRAYRCSLCGHTKIEKIPEK